jgi:hypothetical protein
VPTGTSLAGMLARKPPMLVMAPANKNGRIRLGSDRKG